MTGLPRPTSPGPVSNSTTGAVSSSLRLNVNLGLALALVILCVVGGAALWNIQRFAQAARERRQGFEVRIRIAGVLADLRDAETGQRGYLLTGQPEYLGPF